MLFDVGESRLLYKSTVERFVSPFDSVVRHAHRNEPAGFSRSRWKMMGDLGLFQLPIAEVDGGLGGDAGDCEVVAQALGYGLAAEPWLECGFWPAFLLQGRAIVCDIASGDRICAIAASERHCENEWAPQATIAERHGNGFRISGRKTLVLGGAEADDFIVTARHSDETLGFLLSKETPGLGIDGYRIVDGGWAIELRLDDVRLSEDDCICSGGRLADSVTAAMLMASAEMVGIAQRLFDETLAYVKTREQFGQAIGRFQVIQHRMVDNYVALEKARSTLFWAIQEGWDIAPGKAAGAKAFVARLARSIAHDAIQLHGGMGITDELMIGHGLKRILLLSTLFADPAHGLRLFEQGMDHGQ